MQILMLEKHETQLVLFLYNMLQNAHVNCFHSIKEKSQLCRKQFIKYMRLGCYT